MELFNDKLNRAFFLFEQKKINELLENIDEWSLLIAIFCFDKKGTYQSN